jgi:hypothetical protein
VYFGDGLGALRDGVLGELTGEDEADGGLDLAGREGALLVVPDQVAGLGGDAREDVVDERVHDGHGAARDAGVGVHLLEDLVDVGRVRLDALAAAASLGLGGLLGGFLGSFGGHFGSSFGFFDDGTTNSAFFWFKVTKFGWTRLGVLRQTHFGKFKQIKDESQAACSGYEGLVSGC